MGGGAGKGPRFGWDLFGKCLGIVWASNAKFQNLTLGVSGLAKGGFDEPGAQTRPQNCLGLVLEVFANCLGLKRKISKPDIGRLWACHW